MNNITITPDIRRGDYERIIDEIASQMGVGPKTLKESYKIYPKLLVLPIQLDPTVTNYSVSPRKAVDTPIPGEIKVDQNDFFAIAGMGLRFGRAAYNSGNGAITNHGNYVKHTYPDPAFYAGTNEAAALNNIMNGTVSLQVSGDTLLDGLLGQEMCWQSDGRYVSSPAAQPAFGGAQMQRVPFPLTPCIVIDGNADNRFNINLGNGSNTNIDGSAASATKNFLYVVLDGWQIKNLSGGGLNIAACRV